MAALRFYLDENLPAAIAAQLRQRGIDAITVRELGTAGETDTAQLAHAAALNRVLCTHDTDYVQLAQTGVQHAGIIIGQQSRHFIGEWVKALTLYHAVYAAEDMHNRLDYL